MLLIISFIGACTDDDAFLPSISAKFTHTTANDSVVTFLNVSENATSYEWDFGDGNTSTERNPIKVYTRDGATLEKEYFVTLKATNVAGASDTFRDTLKIELEVCFLYIYLLLLLLLLLIFLFYFIHYNLVFPQIKNRNEGQ